MSKMNCAVFQLLYIVHVYIQKLTSAADKLMETSTAYFDKMWQKNIELQFR